MNDPKWMKDPSIASIPREKLELLKTMFQKVEGKSQKELMPIIMAMSKQQNSALKFSKEEMTAIISAIRKTSSSEENLKMDQMMNIMRNKKK